MAARRMGIMAFLLCVCLCLMLCPARAASTADASTPISVDENCQLTVVYGYDGQGFAGVTVKLYRVADVSADYRYTLTEEFRGSGLELNGIQTQGEWNSIRASLESFILGYSVTPEWTTTTLTNGMARVTDLKPGMYLAVASLVVVQPLQL